MDEKIKEMICIGASVAAHCQPCFEYHVKKGKETGLSMEEISKATELGEMIGKGAENAMKKFTSAFLTENAKGEKQ